MKLICIMPCRNSAWVLGLSARAVLQWCDELLVLDHASTDNTEQILEELMLEFPCRVYWFSDMGNEWLEMEHRQELLRGARLRGATHIVTVDDDEVLTANLVPDIRRIIEEMPTDYTLQLPWLCLRGNVNTVHAGGIWGTAYASVAWKDDPRCHWSSSERGGYQYHHRHPMGRVLIPWMTPRRMGGLLHLQFLDERRLKAKQYLYQLKDALRPSPDRPTKKQIRDYYSPAVYGRAATDPGPVVLAEAPPEWWRGYEDLMQHLHPEAEPWQLEECRRILGENPGIEVGLDDFGLEL